MKYILSILGALSVTSSMLVAGVANITYGTKAEVGGAQFYGSDGLAAESVTVGYFTSDVFSLDLTGWNALATNSVSPFGGWFSATTANTDTADGDGLTAYLLVQDGALSGLINLASWDSLSGSTPPATTAALSYTIGGSETVSSVSVFGDLTVTAGGGTNFAGGSSGTGVSFSLAAVPEPSAYALLGGFLALTCVMLRRRA
jgi:hypothetical protein